MGILTSFLNLLKPSRTDYYNSQTEQADNWDLLDTWAEKVGNPESLNGASKNIVTEVNGHKTKIEDLEQNKSDSVTSTSSTVFATSKAVKTAYDKGVEALAKANTKEDSFTKNSGFNKNKSDSVTSTSSTTLATSKAAKTAYDKAVDAFGQSSKSTSGYKKTGDGVIFQWGKVTIEGTETVTFPVAFPSACRSVQLTDSGTAGGSIETQKVVSVSTTNFEAESTYSGGDGAYWFAIGY